MIGLLSLTTTTAIIITIIIIIIITTTTAVTKHLNSARITYHVDEDQHFRCLRSCLLVQPNDNDDDNVNSCYDNDDDTLGKCVLIAKFVTLSSLSAK